MNGHYHADLINRTVSGWQSLRGLAAQQGTSLTPQYVQDLIKKQGVRATLWLCTSLERWLNIDLSAHCHSQTLSPSIGHQRITWCCPLGDLCRLV